MYYLDSSSIMTGIKLLPGLASKYKLQTSVLSHIERISNAGVDDQSYGRAKSVFRAIEESKINVDWNMPDYYLHSGFDYIIQTYTIVEYRVVDLKEIIRCLLSSTDREDFLKKELMLSLKYPLEYFNSYDSAFGVHFVKQTKEEVEIVKKAFNLAKTGQYDKDVPKEILDLGFMKFAEWFAEQNILNESISVWALAGRSAKEIGLDGDEETISKIYSTYNGVNRNFINAFSMSSILNIGSQNTPGRNDPLDLAHFLYLKEGMTLVVEDKKMKMLAEKVAIKTFSIMEL